MSVIVKKSRAKKHEHICTKYYITIVCEYETEFPKSDLQASINFS